MSNSFNHQDQTYNVGDRLKIHQKIEEEGKTRIQIFEGVLIAIKNTGINQTITIRKISTNSIGVERIFPVKSPMIAKIELKSSGLARRSKLYYLRTRTGRLALRVKEKKQIGTNAAKAKPIKAVPVVKKTTKTKTASVTK